MSAFLTAMLVVLIQFIVIVIAIAIGYVFGVHRRGD